MRGPFVIRPASIPSPAQGVWHLGPIPIRAYALCLIAGFLVAAYVLWRRPAATEALQTRRSHHSLSIPARTPPATELASSCSRAVDLSR